MCDLHPNSFRTKEGICLSCEFDKLPQDNVWKYEGGPMDGEIWSSIMNPQAREVRVPVMTSNRSIEEHTYMVDHSRRRLVYPGYSVRTPFSYFIIT